MVNLLIKEDSVTLSLSVLERIYTLNWFCCNLTYPLSSVENYKAYHDIAAEKRGCRTLGTSIPGIDHSYMASCVVFL